ncbi:heterokaryon incompatibility protein-domain-containing protein [Amylocarpus encephaloides]|uniref:Heterokaryon incompatibility protein-domain-containing protein n=1 Tax=Amylocarpus encephaloides TaxID=45428 RepID=A0A9P7YFM8_9HELO|nr:heterokaryon incompatibility protein-domain-containing protein [Amylocarpus encephaloides]
MTGPLIYKPLDENLDEFRLLSFLPSCGNSGQVCCKLETRSLRDLTEEYKNFISGTASRQKNKRDISSLWSNKQPSTKVPASPAPAFVDNSSTLGQHRSRFQWGDFAALSYVWGEPDPSLIQEIIVNGEVMSIGYNLGVALIALSSNSEFSGEYKLWVDAICINQNDLAERNQQVRKMRDIYSQAWTVISWLGVEYRESDRAFQLIQALADAGVEAKDDGITGIESEMSLILQETAPIGGGYWLALHEFMQRPYWFRLWIIQEVALGASSVILRCGNSSMTWETFCYGVRSLLDYMWTTKDRLLELDQRVRGWKFQPWSTLSLHVVNQDLSELTSHGQFGRKLFDFGRLLDLAAFSYSQDERDKVYGLVGIMDPIIATHLVPDYKNSPSQVFTKVARVFIETYRNLDPIRNGNPWGNVKCPSWAADWTWNGRARNRRFEGSAFWTPLKSQDFATPYTTSGSVEAQFSFIGDGSMLQCRGFVVDTIAGLGAREVGFFNWSEHSIVQHPGGRKSTARHHAISSLPSTFFLNGEPQFKKLGWGFFQTKGGYYFRWQRFRLANMKFLVGEQLFDDYFTDTIPEGALLEDYVEVYSSFDRASKGRRLMITESGYIGWAPDNMYGEADDQTMPGDLIAVVFGCSTPVVIRPVGHHFQILGEAYVEGIMEGEAMDFLASGKIESRDFVFC